jgi:small subunit ribosomal protein S3e
VFAQVSYRGLCAAAQVESLRYKLIGGLAVRRACYGVLRFIMEEGARGCEVSSDLATSCTHVFMHS